MSKGPAKSEFEDFSQQYRAAIKPQRSSSNYLADMEKENQLILDGLARLQSHPVNNWLNKFPSYKYTCKNFIKCKRIFDETRCPSFFVSKHSLDEWETKMIWSFTHIISLQLGAYYAMKESGGVSLPNKNKREQALNATKKLIQLLDEGVKYLDTDMSYPMKARLVRLITDIEKNDSQGFGKSNDGFAERRWLVTRLSEYFDTINCSSKTKLITKIVEIVDQDITDAKVHQYIHGG